MTLPKSGPLFICTMAATILVGEVLAGGTDDGNWRTYSEEPNGDVYFYDTSRVKSADHIHRVWSRIRYKTSVMGAASYQNLLEIDCSERTQKIVQNTFFSDKHWKKPAMSPDMTPKPTSGIVKGSATERLSALLCD